jgi:citrate lyase beta subunit
MPGNDWRKIEKAAALDVDAICMDLEDGVAPDKKEDARQMAARALAELDFGKSERLVRINPLGSELAKHDLETILPAQPDGIVIPKAESAEQLLVLSAQIAAHESKEKPIALLAQIESALGLVEIKAIASAADRLQALIFGAEDYAADLGARRTPEADEVFFARSSVVAHAAANDLQAIDMLWTDFKDPDGLAASAAKGAQLGYSGMQIIHPNQIEIVQRAFTPTPEELTAAHRIVDAYEASLAEGKGVFALDGKMIDMPMVKAARRLLSRAQTNDS